MNLTERITQANTLLAPYAIPHGEGLGREKKEKDDATRFPFQRDRDRIIHSDAFRRLKHKTQVFASVYGDHYRTRLTHTLEVAQISRDIARTLQLNEDLVEAIALAHDLGHTPFGHAGEEALNECMKEFGKRFEHNEQSYRICTILEERKPGVYGLNLNREILNGLLKHSTPHDFPSELGIRNWEFAPSLEAQLVNLADEIAYTAHDAEDGMRAGLFTLEQFKEVLPKEINPKNTTVRSALIDLLVMDLYSATEAAITQFCINSSEDVYRAQEPIVQFSQPMKNRVSAIREFLWQHMYLHKEVRTQTERGKKIICALFSAYLKRPLPEIVFLDRRTDEPIEDAVKDYVAGMTDTFAMEKFGET